MLLPASTRRALRQTFAVVSLGLAMHACRSGGLPPPEVSPTGAARPVPAHHVIPMPVSIDLTPGAFLALAESSRVAVSPGEPAVRDVATLLAATLRRTTGYGWPLVDVPPGGNATGLPPGVRLALDPSVRGGREAYRLEVTSRGVELSASAPEGLFRGSQTLIQLLPPAIHAPHGQSPRPQTTWRVPIGTVTDAPRYAWRGAMLDVARHFFDVDQVKRYIDLLALYKINVLHLHLSDDQGWRIVIDSWPRLATHGGSTGVNGDRGGYFTKAEYRDLVAYAAARYILVVPEIDMPGHTNAALASYAELNCNDVAPALYTGIEVGFSSLCVGKDVTYRFIDDVVREIAALTPGPYLHIGGDEVKTLGEAEYAGFIERVQAIVARHGKQAIGWEEIAHATLAPTTIVQQWRAGRASAMAVADAATASAVAQGARLVLSPASRVYLDMKYDSATRLGLNWAGYIELRDAYDWDPATMFPGVTDTNILGIEAPLWTETIVTMTDLETMALPRLPAVAEVGWSPQAGRAWDDFRARVAGHALRWDAMAVAFYRSPQVEWITSGPGGGH